MIDRSFFQNDTLILAKKLIGMKLVHHTAKGITSGMIVETEAYLHGDPAAHGYTGKTARTASMFEEAGIAYVYFIYGMYYCFNVVSGEIGKGEAVLIRALEPLQGIPLMQERRGRTDQLCNGPGKLTIAMGITKKHDGVDLCGKELFLTTHTHFSDKAIGLSKRIGISKAQDKDYRFYLKQNSFVSQLP